MLYNYFKARFKSKLDGFGRKRLELEKKRLKDVTDNKLRRCEGNNPNEMCKYYHKPEIPFMEELKSIQNRKMQLWVCYVTSIDSCYLLKYAHAHDYLLST